MKNNLFRTLVCLVLCCLMTGTALAATVEPYHDFDVEAFGTGDMTVQAEFDALTAFEEPGRMAFDVKADDLYAADEVKALKSGDTIVVYGEEYPVKAVRSEEDGQYVVELDDGEADFYPYSPETPDILYTSDTDIPARTVLCCCSFPLADQVAVRTWVLDADGNPSQELITEIMDADQVADFFAARSDDSRDDYLNCSGEHVQIRVTDDKVTEIEVDWGSDD